MGPDPQFLANLVTFTEEILNGKFHFCAVIPRFIFTAPRSAVPQIKFAFQFFIVSFSRFTIFIPAPTSSSDFISMNGLPCRKPSRNQSRPCSSWFLSLTDFNDWSFVSRDLRLQPFCSSGKRSLFSRCSFSLSVIMPVIASKVS